MNAPLAAVQHLRPTRGGSRSLLMRASDGHPFARGRRDLA